MQLHKKILLLISIFITFTTFAWAAYTRTLLVLDMHNIAELPRNFRTTSDLHPHIKNIKWDGLADLHMAGGAQFSHAALNKVTQHLLAQQLTIIDLRQESHGFLDGAAISWYAPHDAVNAGKTPEQIETDQTRRLNKLENRHYVKVNSILKKNSAEVIEKVKVVEYPVRHVQSEEEFVQKNHLTYERIYVQDFHSPMPDQVDRFIAVTKKIPRDGWIYFHCRAGVGRTTTFMVMYDMMRNAKGVSFDDILARQAAIGGKDLTEMPAKTKWKYRFAVERLAFLKKFYEYAHDNDDDFQTSWSEWLSTAR